ncbi:iron chelate uptake ABC transporter family permease subunit, partial [Serratia marcescens]|uniref:iron chelate uptake ABC transporter family permease subunit n=1 Tax=Serratia marcescens TaxID=615 RepID=UPI00201FE2CF
HQRHRQQPLPQQHRQHQRYAAAIAGALAMTFLLLGFARRRRLTNARLLLVGVALGIVCSALMTWAVYFSTSLDLRQLM